MPLTLPVHSGQFPQNGHIFSEMSLTCPYLSAIVQLCYQRPRGMDTQRQPVHMDRLKAPGLRAHLSLWTGEPLSTAFHSGILPLPTSITYSFPTERSSLCILIYVPRPLGPLNSRP